MNDRIPSSATSPATSAAPSLDHLSLIAVRGADARSFLDAQLTRNVPDAGAASLAGYCTPKGRLLAVFVVICDADTIWLVAPRELVAALVKRLRMYVLRAKVTLDDVDASHALSGWFDPSLPAADPWSARRVDAATWIRFPDPSPRQRYLRIAPRDDLGGETGGTTIDAATWRWSDIRAGLPRVGAATQERFVPQMVNLEALGGVDFRKGCFPGQEIVARSQYLGKLKRRTALGTLAAVESVPAPGSDVFVDGGPDPQGVVVDAERGPDGAVAVLAELPVALLGSTALRIGAATGPVLQLEPLPYVLPDNEVFVRPKL